jgi:hypothetical protein
VNWITLRGDKGVFRFSADFLESNVAGMGFAQGDLRTAYMT